MKQLNYILEQLRNGNITPSLDNKEMLTNELLRLLSIDKWDNSDLEVAEIIMNIANISYNWYDSDILPIENGLYDLLSEKYKAYKPNWFSAKPTYIAPTHGADAVKDDETPPYRVVSDEEYNRSQNLLFPEIRKKTPPLRFTMDYGDIRYNENISKRLRDTKTMYPTLVGTLNKYKYVLNSQANEKGVLNNSNVTVLERDFMQPILANNILNYNSIEMIASLKYDGVSIVATCSDIVLQAETRGDTQESVSADVTPIFYGYKFPDAPKLEEPIGIKFEAIMTTENLAKFNQLKGYNYANGRTAIVGLLSSSDAWKYRDLVTLVPLQTNCNFTDRFAEAEFLNQFYTRDVSFIYSALYGDYVALMFQIKRFVEDAEFCRRFRNFMYDGVVLEFIDPNVKRALGRVNSVNLFAAAIKFNPLKKQTIFKGYYYTVGKTGLITPMITYLPVEFFGTIHPESSGHSLKRFKELNLAKGDVIDVEYTNDVMPYVTKPDNPHNDRNPEPKEQFIEFCPSCGTRLVISESGDSARCPNINCPERRVKTIVAGLMMLGVTGFAERSLDQIGITNLKELFESNVDRFSILGPNDMHNFKNQLDRIKETPIADYKIMAAIGIENCSIETWKKIFSVISFDEFLNLYNDVTGKDVLFSKLISIYGVGRKTAELIMNSIPFYIMDINYVVNNFKIVRSIGTTSGPKIRITGFRDYDLLNQLNSYGYDATDGAVTKDTVVLIVPYDGFNQSTKVAKAKKYGVRILSADYVRTHMNDFEIGIL